MRVHADVFPGFRVFQKQIFMLLETIPIRNRVDPHRDYTDEGILVGKVEPVKGGSNDNRVVGSPSNLTNDSEVFESYHHLQAFRLDLLIRLCSRSIFRTSASRLV